MGWLWSALRRDLWIAVVILVVVVGIVSFMVVPAVADGIGRLVATPTPTNSPTPTSTSTHTPVPTSTSTPIPTSTPTSTSTNTPVPTNTPKPTNTPLPTNTPGPTFTPAPPTNTPGPTLTPAPPTNTAVPVPTSTPQPPTATAVPPAPAISRVIEPQAPWNPASIDIRPGAQWAVIKVRLLDPCENHFTGVGSAEAQDAAGKPINGVTVKFQNGPYVFDVVTGSKGEGRAEISMLGPGNYSMWVDRDERGPVVSDVAVNMETYNTAWNLPEDYRICKETREEGNAPKHLAYRVIFRRVQ